MLELDHDSKIFSSLDPPRLLCAQQRRTQIEYSIEAQSQSQPQTDIVRITIIIIGISAVIVTIIATRHTHVQSRNHNRNHNHIVMFFVLICFRMIPFDHFPMFSNSLQELQKALDGSFQQLTMGGRCLVICQSTIDRSLG